MSTAVSQQEPGAEFAQYGVWSLPTRYGTGDDVVGDEYLAIREGAGLAELTERGLLAVAGPTRLKFLHSLLSNEVEGRVDGEGCRAALMDIKGRILAILRVLVTSSEALLELTTDRIERVEGVLTHYRVGAPVRFATRQSTTLALLGPKAEGVLASVGAALPADPANAHCETAIAGAGVRVVRAADLPGGGLVLHATPQTAPAIWQSLKHAGATPVGREALNAARVEAGRAWFGFDVTEEHLLHETGLLRELHSPSKGCYVGQEVVARLEGRGGHVNKALRGLRLTGPVPAGTTLRSEEQKVGVLTTTAVSPRHGAIALGYVHRDFFAPGTRLDADGQTASVADLPLSEIAE